MELYKGDVTMLKKMVAVAGIAITSLSLTGCFGGNKYSDYKNAEWFKNEKVFYVANELVGNVFNDEREDISDELNDNTDFKPVRKENDGTIVISIRSKDDLYYAGEISDNRPDGIGGLYRKSYDGDKMFPIYLGEWEDGQYNGYGQIYTGPYGDTRYSLISYEGIFEDNKPNGEGIDYYIEAPSYFEKEKYNITYAENFDERLKADGNVKKFVNSVLIFEAKIDRDSGYAKGKEYYKNGELKYNGEFKNGWYHGDGVLYDENGKEIYDGEFEKGNYK